MKALLDGLQIDDEPLGVVRWLRQRQQSIVGAELSVQRVDKRVAQRVDRQLHQPPLADRRLARRCR